MGLYHKLTGKSDAALERSWLEHVRGYAPHQSKPRIDQFKVPSYIRKHPFRLAGRTIHPLRRTSGLALDLPDADSAERFKIWEMPGSEYRPKLPHSLLGQDIDEIFRDYLPSFKSRRSFILKIPGGLFHGHDQTLLDSRYNLIDWEPPYWAMHCGLPATVFRGRLPQPKKLRGRALVLSAPGATQNIWHLLFDSLPKLELLKRAGLDVEEFDHILVNSRQARFEKDAFAHLGIPSDKIIETDMSPLIQADELVFVTLGCLIPADPWVLDWVRSRFLSAGEPRQQNRKIYLSRGDASRRRLLNEPALWGELSKQGFEKVEFAGMGLREQIECIESSSVIAAPHGAGLTNLVWANPGTKVIELFSREYVTGCYWLIADMLGLNYAFAIGESQTRNPQQGRAIMDMDRLGSDIVFHDVCEVADRIIDFVRA